MSFFSVSISGCLLGGCQLRGSQNSVIRFPFKWQALKCKINLIAFMLHALGYRTIDAYHSNRRVQIVLSILHFYNEPQIQFLYGWTARCPGSQSAAALPSWTKGLSILLCFRFSITIIKHVFLFSSDILTIITSAQNY